MDAPVHPVAKSNGWFAQLRTSLSAALSLKAWLQRLAIYCKRLFLALLVAGASYPFIYDELRPDWLGDVTAFIYSCIIFIVVVGALWALSIPNVSKIDVAPAPSIGSELAAVEVVVLLRARAKRLREAAGWTMALIVATLVAGTAIFFFAGAQARKEANTDVFAQIDACRREDPPQGNGLRQARSVVRQRLRRYCPCNGRARFFVFEAGCISSRD